MLRESEGLLELRIGIPEAFKERAPKFANVDLWRRKELKCKKRI